MKRNSLLIVMVLMLGGCMKPSDHRSGVEEPPTYPYQQSPSTVHTEPAPAADRARDGGDAPEEFPDSPGSMHTPPMSDGSLAGDGGLR